MKILLSSHNCLKIKNKRRRDELNCEMFVPLLDRLKPQVILVKDRYVIIWMESFLKVT